MGWIGVPPIPHPQTAENSLFPQPHRSEDVSAFASVFYAAAAMFVLFTSECVYFSSRIQLTTDGFHMSVELFLFFVS